MSGSPPAGGSASPPDLPHVAELLPRHDVECVLVGGMSAVLHGSSVTTRDIDEERARRFPGGSTRTTHEPSAAVVAELTADHDDADESPRGESNP